MDLTCPKCHGAMRSYERNGVHVDQCTECRGIFLDRGELERLMEAEARWDSGAAPAGPDRSSSQAPAAQAQPSLGGMVGEVLQQVRAQQSGGHGQQRHQQPYQQPYRKKKSSFLGELFG